MTDEPIGALGAAGRAGPGLTPEDVAGLERALGRAFPSDYVRFLTWADGWEGWVGSSYLRLHSLADLPFANDADFREAFPGLVAIGSEGGLETYALDYRPKGQIRGVVTLDRTSSDKLDILSVAASFTEALALLASRTDELTFPDTSGQGVDEHKGGAALTLVGTGLLTTVLSSWTWGICPHTPCGGMLMAISEYSGLDLGFGVVTALAGLALVALGLVALCRAGVSVIATLALVLAVLIVVTAAASVIWMHVIPGDDKEFSWPPFTRSLSGHAA